MAVPRYGRGAVPEGTAHFNPSRSRDPVVRSAFVDSATKLKVSNLKALKEWNRVKDAWNGDVEGWQRYSGLTLTEEEIDGIENRR